MSAIKKFTLWTIAVIGSETKEERHRLADYQFIRWGLIADPIERYRLYTDEMKKLLAANPDRKSRAYQEICSKFDYELGKIALQMKFLKTPPEVHFRIAFEARQNLLRTSDESQKDEDLFYLAETRYGLISCWLLNNSWTSDILEEAKKHVRFLSGYVAQCEKMGNKHISLPYYKQAIEECKEFLKQPQLKRPKRTYNT